MSASARGGFAPASSRPPTAGSFVSLDSPRRTFFKAKALGLPSPADSPRRSTSGSITSQLRPASGRSDLLGHSGLTPRAKPPFGASSPRTCMPIPKPPVEYPRQPTPEYCEENEKAADAFRELETFHRTFVEQDVRYEKPIGTHLLSKFLFRRSLALRTPLAAALRELGQPWVIAKLAELGVGENRMNSDDFHFAMCAMMRGVCLPLSLHGAGHTAATNARQEQRSSALRRELPDEQPLPPPSKPEEDLLSPHSTLRIFEAMDWNGSGIVDGEEIVIGLNILFRTTVGSIAVFTKKTLDARAATDDFISLAEVHSMLSAIASLCDGRYAGAQEDVRAVMSKLSHLASDSAVPLEWVQEFVMTEAPLISKILSELPRDGSEPTPAALGRLPSPDPVNDVEGILAAAAAKKQKTALASSGILVGKTAAASVGLASSQTPAYSQEQLQNPRFNADLFRDNSSRSGDVPEHVTQEYYSISGVVWRRGEKGAEVVT